MNILIITPIFTVDGRRDIQTDSSAVHYLIEPWKSEHNVIVIHVQGMAFREIHRFIHKDNRDYYKNGYYQDINGIKVRMCEIQRRHGQPNILDKKQERRLQNFVVKVMEEEKFIPDVVVNHIPTSTQCNIRDIFPKTPIMGVLHYTDVLFTKYNHGLYDKINLFDSCYCRSRAIYNYFSAYDFNNLHSDIVWSGVPQINSKERTYFRFGKRQIMYAGKLIKRKHIDLVILALSRLQNQYDFKFEIYGGGKEEKHLKLLARKN